MNPTNLVASLKAAVAGGSTGLAGSKEVAFDQILRELQGMKSETRLTNFLELSYDELKERNLAIKKERAEGKSLEYFEKKMTDELKNSPGVKAVMVAFSDLEGKLHILDYDKDFVLAGYDNLTFDGSSITGFTDLANSDLRLKIDWSSMKWLPADIFGPGKVMVFGFVSDKDGTPYHSDYRSQLYSLAEKLKADKGVTVNVAPEVEGFLFEGIDAEQNFKENGGFHYATKGGYFNTLPQDKLRQFIDRVAEVQRALGFENEKDHPEVAPAQFEINFKYADMVTIADQILLYKLTARQIAKSMGYTASFLPKPVSGVNGSGMHVNMSFSSGKNVFYDASGEWNLSEIAHKFLTGILYQAPGLCLIINPSVNSYRRLDPNFEAPNAIKVCSVDRGSMIRVPLGNEKSARIEVRSVAPDVNPYMTFYAIVMAGLSGIDANEGKFNEMKRELIIRPTQVLPGTIYGAIDLYEGSEFMGKILGEDNKRKYGELKRSVAERSPQALGARVKSNEVLFHHEIRNQVLWEEF